MFKIVVIEAMHQPVMLVGPWTLEGGRESVMTLNGSSYKVPVVVRQELAEVRCCMDWTRDVIAAYKAERGTTPANIHFTSIEEIDDVFAPWLRSVSAAVGEREVA